MKWYCVLKENQKEEGFQNDRLYEYKTTRDYDQMFTVFNGAIWIPCEPSKFNMYYVVTDPHPSKKK